MEPNRPAPRPEIRYLIDHHLLVRESLIVRDEYHHILSLSEDGKAALEALRVEGASQAQVFYAGAAKPREYGHDSQLFAMFELERQRLEQDGAQITRVRLDYELKQEYQTYLNRTDVEDTLEGRQAAFAAAHGLTVVDGHLQLPDLRIEYETADGRQEHRDVELVTAHYSRSQIGRKARAGFTCYRAGGSTGTRGTNAKAGGTPRGSDLLKRLI